jgi:hypothetical protein
MPSGCAVTALVAAGAQVGAGEPFEDLVREPVGRLERELERRRIGHAASLSRSLGLDSALGGECPDLDRGAVHQHRADAQRPEHGHVHQDVGEVLVRDGRAVDGDHERLLAELRDVLEDAPEVGRPHAAHVSRAGRSDKRGPAR